MSYALRPAIVDQARRLFPEADLKYVLARLADTPLPWEENAPPPRVHLAVLWLSKGNRASFDYHLTGATSDWRDTLIEAGLANDNWRDIVEKRGISC